MLIIPQGLKTSGDYFSGFSKICTKFFFISMHIDRLNILMFYTLYLYTLDRIAHSGHIPFLR